jgi:hypothetical protein
MEYNDFKNVILILVKSAPKKTFSQKTVLPIGKLVKCQKNLFFGQSFFWGGGGGVGHLSQRRVNVYFLRTKNDFL